VPCRLVVTRHENTEAGEDAPCDHHHYSCLTHHENQKHLALAKLPAEPHQQWRNYIIHEHEFIQPQQRQCRWLCAAQQLWLLN